MPTVAGRSVRIASTPASIAPSTGPFVRADLGWGFLSAADDDGDEWAEDKNKSGPAALFGVGYAFPVGAGGTRILLNLNYALRPGIDAKVYGDAVKGSVRALSFTVGGLF